MMPEIVQLGNLAYADAWERQKKTLTDRVDDKISDTLLIVEHPHVVTLGRRTPGVKELEASGAKDWQGLPLFFVERGGEATYHGPGQLVMYPIFRLELLRTGPKAFLRMMENAIIDVLLEFGIESYFIEGKTGVWLKDASNRERKIASLGIAVRHSVSYHGLALNVSTDLKCFEKISPCGFQPSVMTNMQEVLGKNILLADVSDRLAKRLVARFLELKASRLIQ